LRAKQRRNIDAGVTGEGDFTWLGTTNLAVEIGQRDGRIDQPGYAKLFLELLFLCK